MKILVVQLLRLGDILLSGPVITGLRRKFPAAEIHILAFRGFAHAEELFEPGLRWHWLDRDGLQAAISDADQSFFSAADLLASFLNPLKDIQFDHAFNLTQTKLSGWVCSHLAAKQTTGLHFDRNGQAQFGSPWFKYLNDHVAAGNGEVFHFTDIFRFGCEVDESEAVWSFRRQPARQRLQKPYVLVQTLTSDAKKNYPAELWKTALREFQVANPRYSIGVLASPAEAAPLRRTFESFVNLEIVDCSLPEALALMDEAELLVTGDTSIKHLSCASRLPVLELSLGSSDYRKTGIYKTGSWILQAKTACAPCPHSSPCSQSRHVCATGIAPEAVALAMGMLLNVHQPAAAKEFGGELTWQETYISPMGFWMTKDLAGASSEFEIQRCIEKSTWKFLLQREFNKPLAPFGTESLRLRKTFLERYPNLPRNILRDQLEFLESETEAADENVSRLLQAMRRLSEQPLDPDRQSRCLESVREFCDRTGPGGASAFGWLVGMEAGPVWPEKEQKVLPIGHLRRLQVQLDEMVHRTGIKLKLIRSLKSQIQDQGVKA